MTWLVGWTRRKIKVVSSLTIPDYQMKLIVHKSGLGPDTYTDIYLGDHCRDDFSDLRFTGPDATTLLSYWIESISGASPNQVATVWIKVPALAPVNNIYIYYDNPVATSLSNGTDTFVFFDDFESGTIDPNKWTTQIMYGSMGIRIDKKYGAYSYGSDQGPSQGCCWPGYVNPDQNHYFMKLPDSNNIQYLISMKAIRWATTAWTSSAGIGFGGNTVIYGVPSDNVWRNYDIILKRTSDSNINYQVAVNGVWGAAADIAITQGTILPFGVQTMHFGPADNSVYVRSDDFRVRKYVSPEPIFGVSGTEELNVTAIDMVLDKTSCVYPCTINAYVTWHNYGNTDITSFTTAVLIDNTTLAYGAHISVIPAGEDATSGAITTPILLLGSHTICPYPN